MTLHIEGAGNLQTQAGPGLEGSETPSLGPLQEGSFPWALTEVLYTGP